MGFSTKIKSRAWIVVVQIKNMINAGLLKEQYENPEYVSAFFLSVWENSGKNRTGACAVCFSADGLLHLHLALYCENSTTLLNVSKIMFNSHTEPQLGGKKQLQDYLQKEGKYLEKGEIVIHTIGIENIQDKQGKRSDIEYIEDMLNLGMTPNQILETKFAYRRYESWIKAHYISLKKNSTPLIKDMICEWRFGASGTGKSYHFVELCEKYSPDNIYLCNDYQNGGMDFYTNQGCPNILFMDEYKGELKYGQLLTILDKYSRTQTHSRYVNNYNLFTHVVITSIYSPEECYEIMVDRTNRQADTFKQLLRRLNKVVYHWKEEKDGQTIYRKYELAGNDYKNRGEMIKLALGIKDDFMPIEENENPFRNEGR